MFQSVLLFAIETAIIFNFYLNNIWTFSTARLRGKAIVMGFAKYNVACLFGAVANYAVSSYLYEIGWIALLAVIAGAMTGIIWNYTMSRLFAWRT